MQNAESNPTQSQQKEIAAKSPAKTPAAGTESPDAKTQAREFGKTGKAMSAESFAAKNTSPLPKVDVDLETNDSADPVVRAASRIVSVDNAGMALTDSTVDTDGKTLEARRNAPLRQDNIVTSNASPDGYMPSPDTGITGPDSRPEGNLPRILPRDGYRVVHGGTSYDREMNGSRAELLIRFEKIDDSAK